MYKIKEFSEVTNTSIVTLRYYDEIGLFKPQYVDFYSGYRYYEDSQIKHINKINKLKEFELSLEEIKLYIETGNNEILINKIRGYENMVNKINEFLNEGENKKIKIIKADYKKFLELNGLLNSRSALALEIKDNNAYYYYIEENDTIVGDFAVYKEQKWLTLNINKFNDTLLINAIFDELKKDFDVINIIVPIEEKDMIDFIKSKYNCDAEDLNQDKYKYKKLIFKL